ncbi:hypothetical protein CIPAW_04G129100 [Carya illinoinensis]|uniref:Uncharacterized protein n=1 Tax=Carya illinoinensis TaxID=32201 RepID=A0A8T1QV40_CARIL|nr:hypothetical protein CIPAW_04G129100 [Carya illinoinensis]
MKIQTQATIPPGNTPSNTKQPSLAGTWVFCEQIQLLL